MGGSNALGHVPGMGGSGGQMTATEIVTIIVASAGAIATGIGAMVNSIRNGTDPEIKALERWKFVARRYIADLRGVLADRGIQSPEPPPELKLYGGDPE